LIFFIVNSKYFLISKAIPVISGYYAFSIITSRIRGFGIWEKTFKKTKRETDHTAKRVQLGVPQNM
jgi:hypothetical protein